jgi:hypothetical protein
MSSCGDCRFYRRHTLGADGTWLGDCRHQPQRGDFKPDAPICINFLSIEAPIPVALPEQPARHRSRSVGQRGQPVIRRAAHPSPSPVQSDAPSEPIELAEFEHMTSEDLKALLRQALEETETDVQLAPKWEGGTLILKPNDPALQPREIPIDQLLHKVVMIRDRLRVLEQKLNANPKLSDAEKVDLQQYVTRCYGSLTTFNQLFRDKADHFVGDRSGEE